MKSSKQNWLDSLSWQVNFYQRGNKRQRTDPEFPWAMIDDIVKRIAPDILGQQINSVADIEKLMSKPLAS